MACEQEKQRVADAVETMGETIIALEEAKGELGFAHGEMKRAIDEGAECSKKTSTSEKAGCLARKIEEYQKAEGDWNKAFEKVLGLINGIGSLRKSISELHDQYLHCLKKAR
jgi:hypothetical protein